MGCLGVLFAIEKRQEQRLVKARDVAAAIAPITREEMRERYSRLKDTDYPQEYLGEEDFNYTWGWFEGVKEFYQRAAAAGRPVIFTAEQ